MQCGGGSARSSSNSSGTGLRFSIYPCPRDTLGGRCPPPPPPLGGLERKSVRDRGLVPDIQALADIKDQVWGLPPIHAVGAPCGCAVTVKGTPEMHQNRWKGMHGKHVAAEGFQARESQPRWAPILLKIPWGEARERNGGGFVSPPPA